MHKRPGVIAVIAVVAVIALILFLRRSSDAPEVAAEPASLSVSKVVSRDMKRTVQLPGEFVAYQEVDIDAKVRGFVQKMNVDIGDVVKEGQVLATLDIPEAKDQLRQAEAAVSRSQHDAGRARAQYQDDKAVYDRLAGVMHERPDLIAQQDLDQVKAKADSSEAAYTAMQSAIDEAQANRARLQSINGYAQITAPFDGTITQRFVSDGALVGDNSGPSSVRAMFHISELQKLRLVIKPPESEVPDLVVGKVAKIEIGTLNKTLDAPISRISHELSKDTRTMHVEIDFDNPDRTVAPGMFAQVSLPLEVHPNTTAVPLGALHERKDDAGVVYVLDENGIARLRKVTLGLMGVNYVEILSGLKPGETVAMDTVPVVDGKTRYTPKTADIGSN